MTDSSIHYPHRERPATVEAEVCAVPGVAVDLDLGGDGAGGERGHHRVGQRQVGQAQHAAPALIWQGPVQPNLYYRVTS